MTNNSIVSKAIIAAALATLPVAATAQNDVTDQANAVAEQAQELQQETNALSNAIAEETQLTEDAALADGRDEHDDDDGFDDWGLLGLLGLAGLLGLKRRDDRHVRVDARGTDRNDRL